MAAVLIPQRPAEVPLLIQLCNRARLIARAALVVARSSICSANERLSDISRARAHAYRDVLCICGDSDTRDYYRRAQRDPISNSLSRQLKTLLFETANESLRVIFPSRGRYIVVACALRYVAATCTRALIAQRGFKSRRGSPVDVTGATGIAGRFALNIRASIFCCLFYVQIRSI